MLSKSEKVHEKNRQVTVREGEYEIKRLTSHKLADAFKEVLLVKFVGENNADELNDTRKVKVGF